MTTGTRVKYAPDGTALSYGHLRGRMGSITHTDDLGWHYVKFDYETRFGPLPCRVSELTAIVYE